MLPFLMCAVFGGVLLIAQFVAGAGGEADPAHAAGGADAATWADAGGHDDAPPGSHPAAAGVAWSALASLAGLRPIAAGLTFLGLAGAALRGRGAPVAVALPVAAAAGLLAAALTAALVRLLLRFESDGAVRLDRALGREAVVYVPIPVGGVGKVQLALQGRLVESSATAADGASYATGARVLVVDRAPDGALLVAADPLPPADPAARGPFS